MEKRCLFYLLDHGDYFRKGLATSFRDIGSRRADGNDGKRGMVIGHMQMLLAFFGLHGTDPAAAKSHVGGTQQHVIDCARGILVGKKPSLRSDTVGQFLTDFFAPINPAQNPTTKKFLPVSACRLQNGLRTVTE